MKNGSCVKCNSKTVYYSDARGNQCGLKTAGSEPYLNIYKDYKWIPDFNSCRMIYYVCRTCGYFEMCIQDLSLLEKLDDCDNWKKIEAN